MKTQYRALLLGLVGGAVYLAIVIGLTLLVLHFDIGTTDPTTVRIDCPQESP